MKKFWKWFFIVLGALVLAGIVFCVTLFALRGGVGMRGAYFRGYAPRFGFMGGMMGGFGLLMMLFRGIIPLAVLVLAAFGIAYLVNKGKKHTVPPTMPVSTPVCASCGKTLASDWTTCPYCGKPVDHPEPPADGK